MDRRDVMKGLAGVAGSLVAGLGAKEALGAVAKAPNAGESLPGVVAGQRAVMASRMLGQDANALVNADVTTELATLRDEIGRVACDVVGLQLKEEEREDRKHTLAYLADRCLPELKGYAEWLAERTKSPSEATRVLQRGEAPKPAMPRGRPLYPGKLDGLDELAQMAKPAWGASNFASQLQYLFGRQMIELDPKPDYLVVGSLSASRDHNQKPSRICTPKYVFDTSEFDAQSLADVLVEMTKNMTSAIQHYPRCQMPYFLPEDITGDVIKAVTVPRIYAKIEAFHLELVAWVELFAGTEDRAEEWLKGMGVHTLNFAAVPRIKRDELVKHCDNGNSFRFWHNGPNEGPFLG